MCGVGARGETRITVIRKYRNSVGFAGVLVRLRILGARIARLKQSKTNGYFKVVDKIFVCTVMTVWVVKGANDASRLSVCT